MVFDSVMRLTALTSGRSSLTQVWKKELTLLFGNWVTRRWPKGWIWSEVHCGHGEVSLLRGPLCASCVGIIASRGLLEQGVVSYSRKMFCNQKSNLKLGGANKAALEPLSRMSYSVWHPWGHDVVSLHSFTPVDTFCSVHWVQKHCQVMKARKSKSL